MKSGYPFLTNLIVENMANTIATRIADFLQLHPPFHLLERKELEDLTEKMGVRYFEKEEVVFKKGAEPGQFFFVVKEGAISLEKEDNGQTTTVDLCDEGDIFGLRPLIAGDQYRLSARAAENSLLYLIPTAAFQPIMAASVPIALYLATLFASDGNILEGKQTVLDPVIYSNPLYGTARSLTEVQSFDDFKEPITCSMNSTIKEAACRMTEKDVGSIIVVNENKYPQGILTDTDLRRKVATGAHQLETPVSQVMSAPVLTIPPGLTVADVQIQMIEHRVHHLCVTADGTSDSVVVGMVSEHDLLVTQGNSPAILIRELHKATDIGKMKRLREKAEGLLEEYLEQKVSIPFISRIMSEINDALISRCLQLSLEACKQEGVDIEEDAFCWLSLGSEGRQEQLLRTDQDNALVFKDPPLPNLQETRERYLGFAQKVNDRLQDAGFEYCPAEMMASNPKWCLSLAEWKQQFGKWIFQPGEKEVMFSTIFFDYRPVFGNASLAIKMTEGLYENIDKQQIFLSFLARNALLNPPPLSFFRNFIVEKNGEHQDEFDLKARAMMPLTDAARVLVLHARVGNVNNTRERFLKMASLEPSNAELYEFAADAYEVLMRFRAVHGLKNQNSGRFIQPKSLNKSERMMLRNTFRAVDEIQQILRTRFQTGFMM